VGHLAKIVCLFVLVVGSAAGNATAQERPAPAAELALGWVGFPDEAIVSETLAGGTARWYVSPRIAIGPEVIYLHGDNHSHFVLTGNLTWDLVNPSTGRAGQVVPFLVVGGGVFQTRETFFNGAFTSNEGAITAGGGVRALVGEAMTAGVDVRVGWETHIRVNGFIGFRFGRR
jgi:hypothetical protein